MERERRGLRGGADDDEGFGDSIGDGTEEEKYCTMLALFNEMDSTRGS